MVDFNRITLMPEALDIENTNQGQKALALLQANSNELVINTDLFAHAYPLIQALPKYGFEWQSLTIGQAIVVLENEPDLQQHFGLDFTLGRQYQQNFYSNTAVSVGITGDWSIGVQSGMLTTVNWNSVKMVLV